MKSWQDSLKYAGTTSAARITDELHHLNYNKQARSTLTWIESDRGRTDKKLIELSDEYARDVLGSIKYAPWLRVYSAMRGSFAEGLIPDNYYGRVVSPLKNGQLGKVADLKTLTNRILNTEALPDVAYIIDGVFYSRDFSPVPKDALVKVLFEHTDVVFFKANSCGQGKGVSMLRKQDFQQNEVAMLSDGVFQSQIKQHDFFAELSPKSTATIRITTIKDLKGAVATRAAYLRVGRATDDIVKSASHVRVPLNRETGALDSVGYMHDWRRIERHPDTQLSFSGKVIPYFQNASSLCQALHQSCPHLTCIGWDVCIDRDNAVKVMEWNAGHNDVKFSEATSGPCFQGLGWESLWKISKRNAPA